MRISDRKQVGFIHYLQLSSQSRCSFLLQATRNSQEHFEQLLGRKKINLFPVFPFVQGCCIVQPFRVNGRTGWTQWSNFRKRCILWKFRPSNPTNNLHIEKKNQSVPMYEYISRMYIILILYHFIAHTEAHLQPLSRINIHSHADIESHTTPHSLLQTKPAVFFTSLGENSMPMFALGSFREGMCSALSTWNILMTVGRYCC